MKLVKAKDLIGELEKYPDHYVILDKDGGFYTFMICYDDIGSMVDTGFVEKDLDHDTLEGYNSKDDLIAGKEYHKVVVIFS